MLENHWKIVLSLGDRAAHLEVAIEQVEGNRAVSQSYAEELQVFLALDFDPHDVPGVVAADEFDDLISLRGSPAIHFRDDVPLEQARLVRGRLRNDLGDSNPSDGISVRAEDNPHHSTLTANLPRVSAGNPDADFSEF